MAKDMKGLRASLRGGATMQDAMLANGWPESQAKRGKAGLGKPTLVALLRSGIQLGESITAADQEKLIRGKLLENALMGNDKAVQSLKLLGQDKRVGMFTADSAAGVVAIQINTPENSKPEISVSGEVKFLPE
jgi:hypothetical protein